ncbi:MAG: DUF445 family protein [Firmicutes bacterium]|jgi:uncharacterized membrane protein YheB (UPF0754 family)|nr:DUF445 family protein [Bacillota bacterium]
MDTRWIVGPVVGAAIGYCTNWLAIKMLFWPVRPVRLLGVRVPFTPGLIPGERGRIAKAIGRTVGAELLTSEVVGEALTTPSIRSRILSGVLDAASALRTSESTLAELLPTNRDRVRDAVAGFLQSAPVRETLSAPLRDRLARVRSNSQTLGAVVPDALFHAAQSAARRMGPEIAQAVGSFVRSERGAPVLRQLISGVVPAWGRLFLPLEAVADKISEAIARELAKPEVGQTVGEEIARSVEGLKGVRAGEAISWLGEAALEQALGASLELLASAESIDQALDTRVADVVAAIPEDTVLRLAEFAADQWEALVRGRIGHALAAVDLARIVEDKVNSLDIAAVEAIILDIAHRELAAITWLGGLIGFIMGFLAPLLAQV